MPLGVYIQRCLRIKGLLKSLGGLRRTSRQSASDGSGRRLAFAGRVARRAQSITPRLARFSIFLKVLRRFSKLEKDSSLKKKKQV